MSEEKNLRAKSHTFPDYSLDLQLIKMSKGFKVSVHSPHDIKLEHMSKPLLEVGFHPGLYSESLQEIKLYKIWALLYLLPLLLIALTWKEILYETAKIQWKILAEHATRPTNNSLCHLWFHTSDPPMPQMSSNSHVIPSATVKLI